MVPGIGVSGIFSVFLVTIRIWLGMRGEGVSSFVPSGVPLILLPLLYVVELISLGVRPFAMLLRIVINLACGHLLLNLSGGSVIVVIVLGLEVVVCVVQRYVLIVMCFI